MFKFLIILSVMFMSSLTFSEELSQDEAITLAKINIEVIQGDHPDHMMGKVLLNSSKELCEEYNSSARVLNKKEYPCKQRNSSTTQVRTQEDVEKAYKNKTINNITNSMYSQWNNLYIRSLFN